MSNILITGANGFIGSALAEKLVGDKTNNVVGLVRDINHKTPDVLSKMSVVMGDLTDEKVLRYAVSHYEVDAIFHLGACTILRQGVVDPRTCFDTNIMGTVNVLEAARTAGKGRVKKVVVASSDKAYGTQPTLPYTEDMSMCAEDPYSTSKACADLLARSYAYTYDMDVSVVRAGNVYGPGDLNFSRLVPRTVLRALMGHPPVLHKGVEDFRREFMYIDDITSAYMTVARSGLPGEAYNVGGAGFYSIMQTMQMILGAMRSDLEPVIIEKDFVEIKDQYLDASKLSTLGWRCEYTFPEGIVPTVEWYKGYAAGGGVCSVL
jgi:CDP-glucose 4,6-dehydratase